MPAQTDPPLQFSVAAEDQVYEFTRRSAPGGTGFTLDASRQDGTGQKSFPGAVSTHAPDGDLTLSAALGADIAAQRPWPIRLAGLPERIVAAVRRIWQRLRSGEDRLQLADLARDQDIRLLAAAAAVLAGLAIVETGLFWLVPAFPRPCSSRPPRVPDRRRCSPLTYR
ncbi:hypothetical protein ABNX41_17005 [Rhodobacteraceae bacterium PA1-206B]